MAVAVLAESDGRRDRRLSVGDFEWTRADLSARIAFELRCPAAACGQRHLVFSKNGAYVCGRDLKAETAGGSEQRAKSLGPRRTTGQRDYRTNRRRDSKTKFRGQWSCLHRNDTCRLGEKTLLLRW